MMLRLLAPLALAAALGAADGGKPTISREALVEIERAWDRTVRGFNQADPYDVLGGARGLYLPGYGVVLTSEMSLVMTPAPSPFAPQPDASAIARVHQRKVLRLETLKQNMRQMLAVAAAKLTEIPQDDRIALSVTLYYRSWEDRTGLPNQLVMRGERKALLASKGEAPAAAIQTDVY
jgi:hypothetical protein